MLIDAGSRREAVLCMTAIHDQPNDDGSYWTEFYPVDLLLELRHTDKLLIGHPLLDLKSESEDDLTVIAESLRLGNVRKIRCWCQADRFVALRMPEIRGKRTSKVTFTWRKGSDYLTEEELLWLKGFSESGYLVAEKLQAVMAMGEFIQGIAKEAAKKKKKKGKKKKRQRRKDRRANENQDQGGG